MYGTLLFTCVIVHVHVHVCIYRNSKADKIVSRTLYDIMHAEPAFRTKLMRSPCKIYAIPRTLNAMISPSSAVFNVHVAYTATVMWVWSCSHDDVIYAGNVWECQLSGSTPYRLSSVQLFQCLHHMCSSLWDKLGKTIASFPGLPHSRISQHSRKSVVHIKYSPDCFQAFPYSNTMS